MIKVFRPNGPAIKFDLEDWLLWQSRSWNYGGSNRQYLIGRRPGFRKQGIKDFFHRLVCPTDLPCVDHINQDTLDNRRCNLRGATKSQNAYNSKRRAGASSPYRGAYWAQSVNKLNPWAARIGFEGKLVHLGYFKTPEEASRAYEAAKERMFNGKAD